MKKLGFAAGAALLVSSAMVQAGGIERTAQSVDIIFEEGTLAEFGISYAMPSVTGVDPTATATGVMSPNYASFTGAYKTDIGNKIGLAVIFDQPYGSLASYSAGFYNGTKADLTSSAVTVVGSYDVSDRFMVYGGATYQSMTATAAVPAAGNYTINAASGSGTGFVAGAAYQIPDIAMRVALTYRSSVTSTHATIENSALIAANTAGSMSVTTPESFNLEFQTGVNPKTLVFGSIRWVNWSAFDLTPANYPGPGGSLINYTDDRVTFNLGVGRKLSDTLSAAVTVGYERDLGGASSALGPTDGFVSLGAGLTYTMGNTKISGGAKYIWLGDTAGPAGTFSNNSALGLGVTFSIAM